MEVVKTHKHVVDFSRIEPGIFGPEPDWMKEKRNADLVAKRNVGSRGVKTMICCLKA